MIAQIAWTLSLCLIALTGCSESDSAAAGSVDVGDGSAADATVDAPFETGFDIASDTPVDTESDGDVPPTDVGPTEPVLCQARIGCNPADFDDIDVFEPDTDCPAAAPAGGGECTFGVGPCYYCEDPDYEAPHGDDPAPWVMWTCSPEGAWVDRTPGVACSGG